MPVPRAWRSLDFFIEETNHDLPIADSERFVSFSLPDLYPEWQQRAHCADTGHDMYFGNENEQPTMSIKQVRNAAKLCDVCPVYDECLRHALTVREEYGVWAGTSGRARRKLFSLLDKGETTIEKIIEAAHDGRRGKPASVTLLGERTDASPDRPDAEGTGPLAL